jgi:hypothetical protein
MKRYYIHEDDVENNFQQKKKIHLEMKTKKRKTYDDMIDNNNIHKKIKLENNIITIDKYIQNKRDILLYL